MSIFYKKKKKNLQGPKVLFCLSTTFQEYDPESPKLLEENLEEGEVDAEGDPVEVFSLPAFYKAQAKASHLMFFLM